LINGIFSLELGAILIASFVLFTVGVVDDYREISAGLKLVTQILSAVLVISCGIVLRVIPTSFGIFAPMGNALLTVFWIIGITNAMNFFDGMDGLAAGLGAMIAFFLGVVAFQTAQPFVGWIAVAMMGSCLGFLPFNFKARGARIHFSGRCWQHGDRICPGLRSRLWRLGPGQPGCGTGFTAVNILDPDF
jgi:UDP-GlcNAc:undecaprenyl-phosphate GlcNAc-1-phosphate transferase